VFLRQNDLEKFGYTVLHFSEGEVLNDIISVSERIALSVNALKNQNNTVDPPPNPLRGGN
jgi:very-short-patch-repair endonuclease